MICFSVWLQDWLAWGVSGLTKFDEGILGVYGLDLGLVVDARASAVCVLQVSNEGITHFSKEHEGKFLRVLVIGQTQVDDPTLDDVTIAIAYVVKASIKLTNTYWYF